MKNVFRFQKMPSKILNNRDRKLVTVFWATLLKIGGTKIKLNIAYHPKTDGQIEQTNRTLDD
jgi:hypothetical protein